MDSPSLSPSVEDYLKAVYSLNEGGRAAGTNELARVLAVQPGSVSGMIRRLAGEGLLQHEPYRGVRLTEEGSREALKILRRHRIIESFLVQRLGYDWDDVHAEAERLEHAASERLIEAMAEALGHPATDPHGAPIPTRAGGIDPVPANRLDEVAAGSRITVRSVADEDPVRLRYLKSVGLVPGARAVVRRGGG
ncbi:MAG: metal-dependent transcriptional regulator, partial [Gemmatimonadetes bacterium]|nr:metal-dependent transcriptional regulator [Gemmatimonadota bacterium]MYC00244.1 metal-dependent transcriptional regulator [Gemmatimonadota bacterium]